MDSQNTIEVNVVNPTTSKRISDPKPRDGTTTKDEQELVQSGSVFLNILMNRIKTKE